MLLTTSPRTTIAKHSTGWQVMRMITDRGGKNRKEVPAEWGKHRLLTAAEAFTLLEQRVRAIRSVMALRETRP